MGSKDNLKKGNPETQFKSGRQAVENGKKGGVASARTRKQKREIKKAIEDRVYTKYKGEDGEEHEGIDEIASTLYLIATDPNHKQVITAQRLIFELLGMDKSMDEKKRIKQALKLQQQEIELNEKRIEHFEDDKW